MLQNCIIKLLKKDSLIAQFFCGKRVQEKRSGTKIPARMSSQVAFQGTITLKIMLRIQFGLK